ncbi:MAG: hypothetical protein KDC46_14005 [Thermoleophilia bacterium]|nr:hypothetical protein [Thermoleophilia bacterium]
MSTVADSISAAAPMRTRRVAAFSALSVGIGGAGHAAVMGMVPDPWFLVAAFAVVFAYAWTFARERCGPCQLVSGLVVIQLAVHGASSLLHPHAAAAHEHLMSNGAGLHGTQGASSHSIVAMLAVHVLATVVGSVMLLRLERHAWSAALDVCRRIAHRLARMLRPTRTVAVALPTRALARIDRSWSSRWIVSCCGWRGPPAFVA